MRSYLVATLFAASTTLAALPAAAVNPPPVPWGPAAVRGCAQAASPCVLSTITRRELSADVAEYSFTMKIGPGAHDVIGLHRVVKELGAFQPVPVGSGILMVHGDAWGFDAAFLASAASPAVPDSRAFPVYLAERGVDVWGIDMRWILVDAGTTDFSFMQSWGLALNASDVGVGLAIAQGARGSSEPLDLLGWSRGGQIAYAYMSTEAALPPAQRRVKGFLPVDIYVRTDDLGFRQAACRRLAIQKGQLAKGVFQDTTGQTITTVGFLAATAPNDPSPIPLPFLSGHTNRQAALELGEAVYKFQDPDQPTPFYHLTGGSFDAAGLPTGPTFTEEAYLLDYLLGPSPFEPVKLLADAEAMMCENDDTPFLDNLDDVTVPVLYVGADGGFGTFGLFSTTLLGSSDKESLIVDLLPAQSRPNEFGHSDLFLATDADTLVWGPIYDWILGIRTQ